MAQCTGVVRLVCESTFHEYVRVLTCFVFVFTGVIPVAHWFHVAKGKGQRWQPDTGSICGSLFTSLRADIICYNPSAASPPVTWHIIVSANTSFIVFGHRRGMDFAIWYLFLSRAPTVLLVQILEPCPDGGVDGLLTETTMECEKWLKRSFKL